MISALDNFFAQDNFIFRRDLQKLRHTLLATGIDFCLKYQDTARVALSGNVYSLNRRAVMGNSADLVTVT